MAQDRWEWRNILLKAEVSSRHTGL